METRDPEHLFNGPGWRLNLNIFHLKEVFMYTPKSCPGFYQHHDLDSFICKCPNCGKEREFFADEFDERQRCSGCGKEIDFTKCTLEYPKFKKST
jgi:ribosomal protein S27AE